MPRLRGVLEAMPLVVALHKASMDPTGAGGGSEISASGKPSSKPPCDLRPMEALQSADQFVEDFWRVAFAIGLDDPEVAQIARNYVPKKRGRKPGKKAADGNS
jgi:hypothetical protein